VRSGAFGRTALYWAAQLDEEKNWKELLVEIEDYMIYESIDVLQIGFLKVNNDLPIAQKMILSAWFAFRFVPKKLYQLAFRSSEPIDNRWSRTFRLPIVINNFVWGTHCYAISRRFAKSLEKYNNPPFLVTDRFFEVIARETLNFPRFKIARLKHSLAYQRGRASTLVIDSDVEFSSPSEGKSA
jgi:hypothetical protein